MALGASVVAPYDPIATSFATVRKAPSAAHWFGTDEIGRDVLSRVVFGARASLLAGVVSVLISLSIGVPVGLLAGYAGGMTDMLISRVTDALLACPFLILAIALAAFLGPSLTNAMIAIGISATPVFIRLTRGTTLADQGRGLRARRARDRQRAVAHRDPARAAEHRAAAARAGDARDRGGRHRRGEPVVPRPRPATAAAELGQHAEHGEELHRQRAVDGDLARACRSSCWCCRSTSSATGCATRSTRVIPSELATVRNSSVARSTAARGQAFWWVHALANGRRVQTIQRMC